MELKTANKRAVKGIELLKKENPCRYQKIYISRH